MPRDVTGNMDQLSSMLSQLGESLGKMRRKMTDEGLPEAIADEIVKEVAHQFAAGSFNKPKVDASSLLKGLGGQGPPPEEGGD